MGRKFLAEAARIGIRVSAVPYPMDRADTALQDLRDDRVNGASGPGELIAVRARCPIQLALRTSAGHSSQLGEQAHRQSLIRENTLKAKAPTVPQSIHVETLSQGPWR